LGRLLTLIKGGQGMLPVGYHPIWEKAGSRSYMLPRISEERRRISTKPIFFLKKM